MCHRLTVRPETIGCLVASSGMISRTFLRAVLATANTFSGRVANAAFAGYLGCETAIACLDWVQARLHIEAGVGNLDR